MAALKEKSSGLATTILYLVSVLTAPMFYIYALCLDFNHENWGMFAADLAIVPMGMIHGLILFIQGS